MRYVAVPVVLFAPLLLTAQFDAARPIHGLTGGAVLDALDMDGDWDLDLVTLVDGNRFMSWNNSNGSGNFGQDHELLVVPEGIAHYVFADINGDQATDLVYISNLLERVAIAYNDGEGELLAPLELELLPGLPGGLRAADITGNGRPDLVVTFAINEEAGIAFWPNVTGTLAPMVVFANLLQGSAPTVLAAGDLDGSGSRDLFVVGSDLTAVGLMNVNGDGSEWSQTTLFYNYDYPFVRPQLIDVDGDGDLDIAEANATSVQWAENRINAPQADFLLRVLEPFTTGGHGRFAKLGCSTSAGVVFVPSNPALPVRWSNHIDAIRGFAPRKELQGVARGLQPSFADLDGDGREDLIMEQADGGVWYPNLIEAPTTEVVVPAFDTLCIFGAPYELPDAVPTGGEWSGTWVLDNVLNRSNVSGGGSYPLSYTFYEPQGCPVGDRSFVPLISGPVINPVVSPILCDTQRPIQLTATPATVEWVGIPDDGVLDPLTYTGALIVSVYTDLTGAPCVTFMGPIEVWPTVPAGIQDAGPFCVNAGVQNIVPDVDLPGTSWSGDILASTNGAAIFDPSQGAGEYTVILDRQPNTPQQCPNSDTLRITVSDAIPDVSVTPLPVFCSDGPLVPLTGGLPSGGTWGGPGVTGASLDPSVVGPGEHEVVYTVVSQGCTGFGTLTVQLAEEAIVSGPGSVFCPTDGPVQFSATPEGGSWASPLSATGEFDPSGFAAGEYPIAYTYTAPNGCVLVNAPDTLVILPTTVVTIDPVPVLCDNGQSITITGSPAGNWSGAVVGSGSSVVFDPIALGSGSWDVVLTAIDPDACPGESTITVQVDVCSGLEEGATSSTAILAPNPFTSTTKLLFEGKGPALVQVLDAAGRVVYDRSFSAQGSAEHVIDLGAARPGSYTMRLQQGSEVRFLRALKSE